MKWLKKGRWVIYFVILFFATFGFFHSVMVPVVVDGSSMEPTLYDNNWGMINALDHEPQRFEIVVADSKNGDGSYWIKRCIGLPGETIEYKDGVLYIDGEKVDQPFLKEGYGECEDFGPVTLGEDEYFLMGDHRTVSLDSRYVGPFKSSEIRGILLFSLGS